MWHIGSQVQELKKIVFQNKEVLVALRTNFDKPEAMKELAKRLSNVDSVLQVRIFTHPLIFVCLSNYPKYRKLIFLCLMQRMTIVGVILSFRALLYDAVNAQLDERIPFLYSTIKDIHNHQNQAQMSAQEQAQTLLINEMASAAGFGSHIDPLLLQTVQTLPKQPDFEEEYLISCLLMVFVAVSIPRLAGSGSSAYKVR